MVPTQLFENLRSRQGTKNFDETLPPVYIDLLEFTLPEHDAMDRHCIEYLVGDQTSLYVLVGGTPPGGIDPPCAAGENGLREEPTLLLSPTGVHFDQREAQRLGHRLGVVAQRPQQ